jgi:MFS family permease
MGSIGTGRSRLGRNVLALGAVSLLTDVSSEMIYPLLPVFLAGTLGAGAAAIGAIEGAAEATASLLKLASGRISDRVGRRKPLVVVGYALASAARPLLAWAVSPAQVLSIRLADRVGKGIRTAPRDALIADSVDPSVRGRAYGFHRAMDHTGAVLGPLVAFALLGSGLLGMRGVFAAAAIPAAAAVVVAIVAVKETRRSATTAAARGSVPRPLAGFLAAVALFALGNSTDAFLLLRASQLGVPAAQIPLLWAFFHVVKAASSVPGGSLSDRVGRRPLLLCGWAVYAATYLLFGIASQAWHAWALFAVYGLHFGLTEGVEKALVADLAPAASRGSAFGAYHLTVGLAALPASLLFGLVWDRVGPFAAFATGAGLAGAAALVLMGTFIDSGPAGPRPNR